MHGFFSCFPRLSGLARLLALGLAAAVFLAPADSGAQEELRILAVVNNDVISQFDLQQRIAFIMVSTGQPRTQENADRLTQPALRQLIDERLEAKEAKDRGVEVTDQEVSSAIAEIEQANHMPPGGLTQVLGNVGLPISVMADQLRTRIAWQRNVARRVHALNDVTDEEVDEALAEFKANNDKPQSLVSEILLTIDNPESEPQVRATAQRLVQQVRAGTPFGTLARQFSETTSSNEGDLGWVQAGQLDPKLDAALASMKPGEVSDPIRLINGYHIVELRDRRLPREIAALGSEVLRLSHASLSLAPGASAAEVAAASDKLRQATSGVKSCEDLNTVSTKIGGVSGTIGSMTAAQLPAVLQPVLARLDVNQPSPPTFVEDHVTVLMICERSGGQAASAETPSRDELRDRLFLQRVDAVSRRYIRDLRLAAYIDIRQ
jgi:peptidyl-prolyl cis-trans isomerase SurA